MALQLAPSIVLATLLAATPAFARAPPDNRTEVRPAMAAAPGKPPAMPTVRVSSGQAATDPTPAEQRTARALAAAVFAKGAAGRRAADNAAPAATPEWATAQAKAEWSAEPAVTPTAEGLLLKMPF